MKIAIDGPSGAGKSTIAKAVAAKLNYTYIDTGAMYRAIGLFALENNINIENCCEDIMPYLDKVEIELVYIDGTQHVILNGKDVSSEIRTPAVSSAASKVGAIGSVRVKLVDMQREMSEKIDVIMDGRDIGTNVLPNAEIKIFLTASAVKRAERRYKELIEKGQNVNFDDVLEDMRIRDKNDSERKISPLKKADDAIELDTSELTLKESMLAVENIITEKIGDK